MELQSVWGWQPALYLFLGGMGAGAFVMAAVLHLRSKAKNSLIVCASMWAATISLIVGLLLLLMELITPLRGLLMWQSFSHFTSWMTYGAWGAFCAIIVFGLSALLATRPINAWLAVRWKWFASHECGLRKGLSIAGICLGVFVAFYTGMLLMASGSVPFWDTLLLPALFTASAFDTGIALIEVIAVALAKREAFDHEAKRFMERSVVIIVLIETVVLVAFLASMLFGEASSPSGTAAAASASMFVSGSLAPWFWILVVVAGLILPLLMALRGLAAKENRDSSDQTNTEKSVSQMAEGVGKQEDAKCTKAVHFDASTFVGAIGALAGGCTLRFLVLAAGVHADVISETIFKMIN